MEDLLAATDDAGSWNPASRPGDNIATTLTETEGQGGLADLIAADDANQHAAPAPSAPSAMEGATDAPASGLLHAANVNQPLETKEDLREDGASAPVDTTQAQDTSGINTEAPNQTDTGPQNDPWGFEEPAEPATDIAKQETQREQPQPDPEHGKDPWGFEGTAEPVSGLAERETQPEQPQPDAEAGNDPWGLEEHQQPVPEQETRPAQPQQDQSTELQFQPEPTPETQPHSDFILETEAQSEVIHETQDQPIPEPIPEIQAQPEPIPETQPRSHLVSEPETQPEVIHETQGQPIPEPVPEIQAQPEPIRETQPQSHLASEPEAQPEAIPQAQYQYQAAPIPVTHVQPDPISDIQPQSHLASEPEAQPEAIPQAQYQYQAAPIPVTQVQPDPISDVQPQSERTHEPSTTEVQHGDRVDEPASEVATHETNQKDTHVEFPSAEVAPGGRGPWRSEPDDEVDSEEGEFFNQLNTQTKPIFAPEESESRFEEGIPLLDDADPRSPVRTTQPEKSVDNFFANDEEEADGFFSSVQNTGTKEEPAPHLTRKSTGQVVNSIGVDLGSPASEASAAAQLDAILNGAVSEPHALGPETANEPTEEDLAARWKAELDDEELDETPEDDIAARWEAALDDDDDMLLEDEVAETSAAGQEPAIQDLGMSSGLTGLNSPFESPQSYAQPRPAPSMYTPHQPSTASLLQGPAMPITAPPVAAVSSYFQQQQPPNLITNRGESFAERSKEGYKSPYDLPDDLSRPRRAVSRPLAKAPSMPVMAPPPPVDKSVPQRPPAVSAMSVPAPPPMFTPPTTAAGVPSSVPPPAPKNFYEDLPPPKPRQSSAGRYTPNPNQAAMTGPPVMSPPKSSYAPAAPPAPQASEPPAQSSLQPPEQLDPYTNTLASSAPAGPSLASRYSPQPPGLQPPKKAPSLPRYSPAPPTPGAAGRNRYVSQPLNVPGHTTSLPFQPRTSSPLAHHEKASYQPQGAQQPPSLEPSATLSPPRTQQGQTQATPPPADYSNVPGQENAAPPMDQQQGTPPRNRYAPQEYINEFAKLVAPPTSYAPVAPAPATQTSPPPAGDEPLSPMRRSQTQSPGHQMAAGPRLSVPTTFDPQQRPASVHGSGSPTKTVNPYAPSQARNRGLSQHLEFIAPSDGQEQDPLERWKGAPIFKFGFGGAVVSCFPRHIPRYSAGQSTPMIMPSLGDPKVSRVNQLVSAADTIVQHPGPLKAKSKKKDLVTWLSSKIAAFENEGIPGFSQPHPDDQKRHEEKILLWKVTKILVENDGVLEGSPTVQQGLRQAIFPHLQASEAEGSYGNSVAPSGGFKPIAMPSQSDASGPQWGEELRQKLVMGDRENAVWSAVDRRLWGHALIIASTLDRSIWKQVAQEFVRREVRSATGNTESIAALYDIFAGNVEESVDELVPPSARAGFHLISKTDGQGAARNALDGLDSWRDTLGLILGNRSSEDHQALLALGNLLASYGRTEAAHVCFIFSRAAVFGGMDDPQGQIVLLGADHKRFPSSLLDEDSILLTEAYEFATSVLANSPTANLPHFLAFKLVYAKCLADRGCKSEAQNYCDAVAASLKATTRPSPYYHQYLFMEVDELSAQLRQNPGDGGSSWISKPSMEKVSGSMWARFNSFVVGDDSDAASTGSGKGGEAADFGPFANVAGTPTISRSPSVTDLYGSYPGSGAQPIPAAGPSKYHPSNQYAPNASPEQFRGRGSFDSQRSAPQGMQFPPRRSSQEPSPPVDSHMYQGAPMYGSSPSIPGYQSTPPQTSYMPLAPVEEDLSAQSPTVATSSTQPTVNGLFYQPPGQDAAPAEVSPYYQGPSDMPQAESAAYLPPSATNAYEPPGLGSDPTSAPQEDAEEPSPEAISKKKSFMDDDGDDELLAQASTLKKSENDRKADEAFRKAAEEDAKKAQQQSAKKGWFGGWFGAGGKKEADNVGGGPIRAKLGEDNSFYYDTELKKWVNKKDPSSSAAVRATPPPPKASAPPSRTASSGSMPSINGPPPMMPSGPNTRPPSSSGAGLPPSASPALSGLNMPPPGLGQMPRSVSSNAAVPVPPGTSSAGPPRPTGSLTHAQSIDDLLGAPAARKGNTVRGKKKGRYVDVMAL
ncbi:uncharacterized protein PFLUO_LOCUS2793 [Penicillium psychrofluorescens]|uniref:uncharacterized protein n=1 Tax=Penicillium psychrofluorescens TaxID=3158075 RepID=UPI003CCD16D5